MEYRIVNFNEEMARFRDKLIEYDLIVNQNN